MKCPPGIRIGRSPARTTGSSRAALSSAGVSLVHRPAVARPSRTQSRRTTGSAVERDHEAAVVVLDRVPVRVQRRWGLRKSGEQRGLRHRQVREVRHAEVDVGRRGDAVGLVAVVDLVEVRADDAFLAGGARVLVRQPERLDDLLGLAHVAVRAGHDVLRQEPRPDELLGDRRRAALADAGRVLGHGRDQGGGVDAGVVPEGAVLGRRRRIEDEGRDIGVVDDTPALVLEPSELGLAGAVVDDRRLRERELAEVARIGQVG